MTGTQDMPSQNAYLLGIGNGRLRRRRQLDPIPGERVHGVIGRHPHLQGPPIAAACALLAV